MTTYDELNERNVKLIAALRGLAKQVDLSKLNVKKDFSLMNAHAYAECVLSSLGHSIYKTGGTQS